MAFRHSCKTTYGALTPDFDLVVITTRHEQCAARVNGDSPHRSYGEDGSVIKSKLVTPTHLHAPRTCLLGRPCDSSRVARFHCARTPQATVVLDGKRDLTNFESM